MAKPLIPGPPIWASSPVFATGPFIGLANKSSTPAAIAADGDRPGSSFPTAAEHKNYQDNLTTTWITNWVVLGSTLPDPDEHIVETDATGLASLQRLDVESSFDPLIPAITTRSTEPGIEAINVDPQDPTAFGVRVDGAGSAAFLRTTNGGVLPCVTVINSGPGAGLQAAATTGPSLLGLSGGVSAGGQFDGFLSAPGVLAVGGASAGASAIQATAGGTDGSGLTASTDPGALATAEAILAEGFADGIPLRTISEDGHGAVLESGGALSALRLVPHFGDVGGALDGDLDYNSSRDVIRQQRGGERHSMWATPEGIVYGGAAADWIPGGGGGVQIAATTSIAGIRAPQAAGAIIEIEFGYMAENNLGLGPWPAAPLSVELFDATAAASLFLTGPVPHLTIPSGAGSPGAAHSWKVTYAVPLAGARTFQLRINADVFTNVTYRLARVIVRGSFN